MKNQKHIHNYYIGLKQTISDLMQLEFAK